MKLLLTIIKWIILLGGWVILVGWALLAILVPTSYWVNYSELVVGDSTVGLSPPIQIRVSYPEPLIVHWHIELLRYDEPGWVSACDLEGEGLRDDDYVQPNTIETLFNYKPCALAGHLPPGVYYVQEVIEWYGFMVPRYVAIESNDFEIHAVQETPHHTRRYVPPHVYHIPPAHHRHDSSPLPPFLKWLFHKF